MSPVTYYNRVTRSYDCVKIVPEKRGRQSFPENWYNPVKYNQIANLQLYNPLLLGLTQNRISLLNRNL